MKLTPFQLGLLIVGSFGAIVGLNVLSKAQSNASFRESLMAMNPIDRVNLRTRLNDAEHMEAATVAVDESYDEGESNDEA